MPQKTYRVVALPGDGIGVEVMAAGLAVLRVVGERTGIAFDVEEIACGGKYFLEHGRDWPEGSFDRCKAADVVVLGAVGWPAPDGSGPVTMPNGKMAGWSPVIGLRTRLDLYANIRPVKLYPGVRHRIHGKHTLVWDSAKVDMVMVRENTEGLYAGTGGILAPGGVEQVALDGRLITRAASIRVCRKAFEISRKRGRGAPEDGKKRVTCIVKDNVLHGCRMFKRIFHEVGEEFPDVEKDSAIVDAFTQWLVQKPEFYDVCVTTNMFGDIVTDLASVLQGGMGLAVGCNVGDEHAMFEPIHGSAPKHAGKDRANPLATILAVREALLWLGERKKDDDLRRGGEAIEAAVRQVLAEAKALTYDLVGEKEAKGTAACGRAVCEAVKARLS